MEGAWRGRKWREGWGSGTKGDCDMWVFKSLWIFNVLNLSDSSKMGAIDFCAPTRPPTTPLFQLNVNVQQNTHTHTRTLK